MKILFYDLMMELAYKMVVYHDRKSKKAAQKYIKWMGKRITAGMKSGVKHGKKRQS